MTTVDLYVDAEDGRHSFALHNGMRGPASALGRALWNRLIEGEFEALGPMSCAAYKARLTGRQLTELIAATDLSESQYASGTDPSTLAASLDPDAHYVVQLIEF